MTKPGYTHIIVPRDLHRRLKEGAKRRGLSISKMIELLLEHGINTSINTLGEREKLENCPFSRNVVGRERFELSTFRLSAERSNQAEPPAQQLILLLFHVISFIAIAFSSVYQQVFRALFVSINFEFQCERGWNLS